MLLVVKPLSSRFLSEKIARGAMLSMLSTICFLNPSKELEAFRPRRFCLKREAILGVEERRKLERGRHACQEPEAAYLG